MTTSDWIAIATLTLLMEIFTCFLRFNLGLKARRDTRFLARFTFGLRIHHGYVGLLILIAWWLIPGDSAVHTGALWIGGGLFFSDVVHHFLVLWPIVGNPEFDIFYPKKR